MTKNPIHLRLTRSLVFWTMMGFFCLYLWACDGKGKKIGKTKPLEIRMAEKVIFDPRRTQDFKAALELINSSSLPKAELLVLKGLAHAYQGETYDISARLLSEMQLELYNKANDPHHGSKFPITRDYRDIENELTFWLGMDAYHVYGTKAALKLLSAKDLDSGELASLKVGVIHEIEGMKPFPDHEDYTYLFFSDHEIFNPSKKALPSLYRYLKAEDFYEASDYVRALDYLSKKGLFTQDLFSGHHSVSYYNSSVFKLAALSHFRLAIDALEKSLTLEFSSSDSTVYRFIAITYLVNLYDYVEDDDTITTLWNKEKAFVNKNILSFVPLVIKGKKPYSVDWLKFVHTIEQTTGSTVENLLLGDNSDRYFQTITRFLTDPEETDIDLSVIDLLKEFKESPKKLNQYPTLMSEFIRELNLSDYAKSHKKLVQDVTQRLVFDIYIADKSWQRNRPAFLISLLGTLRWHGARLPNCIEFVISLRKRDSNIGALHEITKLFAGPILMGTFDVSEE